MQYRLCDTTCIDLGYSGPPRHAVGWAWFSYYGLINGGFVVVDG